MIRYKKLNEADSDRYKCKPCGWIYDPEEEGKPFNEQPDTYKCPKCGAPKSEFVKV
jgi:rubredoxin